MSTSMKTINLWVILYDVIRLISGITTQVKQLQVNGKQD